MTLRSKGQLSTRSIGRFRRNVEAAAPSHPPDDLGLGPGLDRQRGKDECPKVGALNLGQWRLRWHCPAGRSEGSRKPHFCSGSARRGCLRATLLCRTGDHEQASSQKRRDPETGATEAQTSVHQCYIPLGASAGSRRASYLTVRAVVSCGPIPSIESARYWARSWTCS